MCLVADACNVNETVYHLMKWFKQYQETVRFYIQRFFRIIKHMKDYLITFSRKSFVKLKEEDHGRMFPVSNKAQSGVDALLTRI